MFFKNHLFLKCQPKEIPAQTTVGGVFFFISLLALMILAIGNSLALVSLLGRSALKPLLVFVFGNLIGGAFAHTFIQGKISVFIHELKHSILSNFAGNKAKSLVVRENSGHFEYKYSKESAKFNAFISLAPYFLPLFTMIALVAATPFMYNEHLFLCLFVGIGYGADFVLNKRDISPIQTDFSLIRGGYPVGLLYVGAINLVILSLLLAWVAHDINGLVQVLQFWWEGIRQLLGLPIAHPI